MTTSSELLSESFSVMPSDFSFTAMTYEDLSTTESLANPDNDVIAGGNDVIAGGNDVIAGGNASGNVTYQEPLSEEFRLASFIVYSCIFLGGLVGNVLFCYIVISSRSMKNVTYHLLVNLSVSDLLITCLCGPVHVIHSLVMGYWPFGVFACYSLSYLQSISVFVSSYTLVVISFERYMSILHPLRPVIPKGGSRYVILAVWIVCLVLSVPNVIQMQYFEVEGGHYVCTSDLDLTFHIWSLVMLFLQYFLPVALMTYFYSMVARTIWVRRDICELMEGNRHRETKEMQMLRSKRKMIKMLIVVVVCYTVCWLPFNVYWVLGLAIPSLIDNSPSFPYVFTVVHILAVSHTCFNPVIYCWMNRRVRFGFMDIMGKLRIIRHCFPSVDWETTRLSRHARQTQFTVVRRKSTNTNKTRNSTITRGVENSSISHRNGSTRRVMNHPHHYSLMGLGRPKDSYTNNTDIVVVVNNSGGQSCFSTGNAAGGKRAGSLKLKVPETQNAAANDGCTTRAAVLTADPSTAASAAAAGDVFTMGGKQQQLHKLSTASNNMEMAELFCEEPLMLQKVTLQQQQQQQQQQRRHKISTASSGTTVTDLSFDNSTGSVTNPVVGGVATGLNRSLSGSRKKKKVSLDRARDIDEEFEGELPTPPSEELKRKASGGVKAEDSDPECRTPLVSKARVRVEIRPKYSRSVSEEIAESCLSTMKPNHRKSLNLKPDDRYN